MIGKYSLCLYSKVQTRFKHSDFVYEGGLGASADPLYDVHDGLDDDAKWAKSNLAMEQGPGKRGTRGLLLKKLLFKLLIG